MYTAMRGFRQAYRGWCAEQKTHAAAACPKSKLKLNLASPNNSSSPSAGIYPAARFIVPPAPGMNGRFATLDANRHA